MGLRVRYKDDRTTVENAYVKVERIWGSKNEGWNCWVGVYAKEGDTVQAVPTFSATAPYVDGENPFKALYHSIEKMNCFAPDVVSEPEVFQEIITETPSLEEPIEPQVKTPVKKTRKKKVKE